MKEFSGEWAIAWHGEIFGPFPSEAHAERLRSKTQIDGAPQDFRVFPLWDKSMIATLAEEYKTS